MFGLLILFMLAVLLFGWSAFLAILVIKAFKGKKWATRTGQVILFIFTLFTLGLMFD